MINFGYPDVKDQSHTRPDIDLEPGGGKDQSHTRPDIDLEPGGGITQGQT